MLRLYDEEGFVFCSRNGTPMTLSNLRRAFQQLCDRAGLGRDWTTYELRHSFVSLVADQLDDLVKVADLAGHVDTRTTAGLPPRRSSVAAARHRRVGPATGERRPLGSDPDAWGLRAVGGRRLPPSRGRSEVRRYDAPGTKAVTM